MEIYNTNDFSSITNNIYNTIEFIFNHKNNITYADYNHTKYILYYKNLFIINHINHKLYNIDKYISYIKQLDINQTDFNNL